MKYISRLTTLFVLIATISNAGMVADNSPVPPSKKQHQITEKKDTDVVPLPTNEATKNTELKESTENTAVKTVATVNASTPTNTINHSAIKQSPQDILNKMEVDAAIITTPENKPENRTTSKSTSKKFAFFTAVGQGDGSVKSVAIGLDIYSKIKWFEGGNWYLTPYTELLVAYWEGDAGHTGNKSLHEGGLSLYGRYIRKQTPNFSARPYIDAGIGLHYVTEDEIEGKELGRQWLAGSNIGTGIIIGKSERFDIGIRVRHLSNGGTKDINWGINHIMARLAIRF